MNTKKHEEFINFLESMKSSGDEALIESVKEGFSACFEAPDVLQDPHRICTTYEVIDEESAAEGDSKEHGWEDEAGVGMELDKFDTQELIEDSKDQLTQLPEPERTQQFNKLKSNLIVKQTVEFLNDKGANQFSSSSFDPHGWYIHYGESTDSRESLETGEITNYGYHLKGYSDEELNQVYDLMHNR